MKKRILFIARSLEYGGVTKSILNLLNTIDLDKYDVHLFIMSKSNKELEDSVPHKIIIRKNSFCQWLLSKYYGTAESIKNDSNKQSFIAKIGLTKILTNIDKAYAAWILAFLCPSIKGDYDTIVDYYGQTQLYYMVEKLKSKKKVTFFHNDYSQFDTYKKVDKRYFKKVDRIFTISPICVESIKNLFPQIKDKVFLMENISSPAIIEKLSNSFDVEVPFTDGALLVTIGHVCDRKGSDLAIEAASILKNRGVNFFWIFVGQIDDSKFQQMIKNNGIENVVCLYGETRNPYPIMKKADIIVHPSRFEGKTIVIDESKILCKPIVATNFSTVGDQLTDGVNASICDMNATSIADSIEALIKNRDLRIAYSTYLQSNIYNNSSEVEKLYRVFDADNNSDL